MRFQRVEFTHYRIAPFSTPFLCICRGLACLPLIIAYSSFGSCLRTQVDEVFSGNTFRISEGAVVRVITADANGSFHEIVCAEPAASSIARQHLLGKGILLWQQGLDSSGTELVSVQIDGIDYGELLHGEGAGDPGNDLVEFLQDADTPITFSSAAHSQQKCTDGALNSDIGSAVQITHYPEIYWRHAFNEVMARGAAEVPVEKGRVDIVNDKYAIEVDRINKWHEAIGQAIHYAEETGKIPAIALYDDGDGDYSAIYAEAQKICDARGITLFRINSYVPRNYELERPVYLQNATSTSPRPSPAPYSRNVHASSGYAMRDTTPITLSVPGSWMRPVSQRPSGDPYQQIHTGPRGGQYYWNSSGNKEYIEH